MLYYIDLFCGAGGVTTGVEKAMFQDQKCAKVIACVNHDPHAIASHLANHPECTHFTEDIRTLDVSPIVDLVKKVRTQKDAIVVLWASCECTNYSRAKGGQSRDADSRTLPEHLFRYIEAINPDYIQIENVEEFMCWGDLDENGHPVSKDKGRLYMRWVYNVKKYGYRYDHRVLNAADYGAYTSRRRYFGIFAKEHLPIAFPEPTHARKPQGGLFGQLKPWKPVREVLCLEDEGESIFTRSKPLCDATLKRIMAGLEKFVVRGDCNFLIKYNSMSQRGKYIPPSIDEPCPTVCTQSRLGVVKARFLMKNFSGDDKSKCISIEKPAGTITAVPKLSLVSSHWVMNTNFSNVGSPISAPCQTVTSNRKMMYLMTSKFPSPEIPSLKSSRNDSATMTELKEFCRQHGIVDIKMRMLRIDELLQIMGFPRDYVLLGTKSENKKYIGNAVECGMARQLCEALYAGCLI